MRTTTLALIGTALAGAALPSVAALGQRAPLHGLAQLAGGRWELRMRDQSGPAEQICLHDGRQLIQLRHRRHVCESFVVSDESNEVTVQYTCHGQGYGRTHVRRETDRLVQIETQGIANGLPFNFAAEGRWVGTCAD